MTKKGKFITLYSFFKYSEKWDRDAINFPIERSGTHLT